MAKITPKTLCRPASELTKLYTATLLNGIYLHGVHHEVFEFEALGFYLYVTSEHCDAHEHEASLRCRYGNYPVFLGRTPKEAQGWIAHQDAEVLAYGS